MKLVEERDTDISILGESWSILYKLPDEDEVLKETCYGYCNDDAKEIVICKRVPPESCTDMNIPCQSLNQKRVLRHEIVHAFLFESGLADSSRGTGEDGWATNEEMVDWFARQSPKIFKVYKELDIL